MPPSATGLVNWVTCMEKASPEFGGDRLWTCCRSVSCYNSPRSLQRRIRVRLTDATASLVRGRSFSLGGLQFAHPLAARRIGALQRRRRHRRRAARQQPQRPHSHPASIGHPALRAGRAEVRRPVAPMRPSVQPAAVEAASVLRRHFADRNRALATRGPRATRYLSWDIGDLNLVAGLNGRARRWKPEQTAQRRGGDVLLVLSRRT